MPDAAPPSPTPDATCGETRRAQRLMAPLVVLLPATWALVIWPGGGTPTPQSSASGDRAGDPQSLIDPNLAPWHELTALPRIGEITARKIVAYREQQAAASPDRPAFIRPDDLERVHGIGPKTVARIRPFLRLAPPGASATSANPAD